MTNETVTLEELNRQPFKEMLMDIVKRNIVLTIQLPEGDEVAIEPKVHLKPLPVLRGYIPEGWKDAIYR
jgi:hypothetical protein